MNVGCRYVVCGQIAQYNDSAADSGPRNLKLFETCRARLEGLRVLDYRSRYAEGIARMAAWLREGRLRYRETVVDGLENARAPSSACWAARISASSWFRVRRMHRIMGKSP